MSDVRELGEGGVYVDPRQDTAELAMIGCFLPSLVRNDLAAKTAEALGSYAVPLETLHLTLVYLGDVKDVPASAWDLVKDALTRLGETLQPFKVSLSGVGYFAQEGGKVVYASVDSPKLPAIRTWLVREARSSGIDLQLEHGFSPHVTLGFTPTSFPMPAIDFHPIDWTVDKVTLAVGRDQHDFPLHGSSTLMELSADLYSYPDNEDRWSGRLPQEGFYSAAFHEEQDDPDQYMYVPNRELKSTWKLPVEDADQAGDAITALQPGGLRGHEVDVPSDSKPAVIAKLRARINKLPMPKEKRDHLLDRLRAVPIKEYVVSTYESNFDANPPKVPTAPGVDVKALKSQDPGAIFITLPIARVNWTSRNGLYYDQPLVSSIADQIMAKRPGGIQGHIPDDERSTSFPLPVCLWIGAVQSGDTLWAKAYVMPGPFRDYIKALKAAQGGISTSIYGPGDFYQAEDSHVHVDNLVLESIDFAPPDRASLQLGGGFAITAEMKRQGVKKMARRVVREASDTDAKPKAQPPVVYEEEEEEEEEVAKEVREEEEEEEEVVKEQDEGATKWDLNKPLSELLGHPGNLREFVGSQVKSMPHEAAYEFMPKEMRKYVAERFAKEENYNISGPGSTMNATVAEMVKTETQELRRIVAEYQRKDFDRAVDAAVEGYTKWHVASEGGQKKLGALRSQFKDQILAKVKRGDAQVVAETAKTVWNSGFSLVAEMAYTALAGPSAYVGGAADDDKKVASDEEAAASRAKLGW